MLYLQLPLTVWAGRVTIDILPDDVLLFIFYFDGMEDVDTIYPFWHRLVHVCRRWRFVVFCSPNFLDLSLVCNPGTCVELTGIWPPLPIIIKNTYYWPMIDFDLAIVHRGRVREIDLSLSSNWPLELKRLASAMEEPFPALKHLEIESTFYRHPAPTLPDEFLGESAPHLQFLKLHFVAFPALPKLLLSLTDLVHLTLLNIPRSGYFSPGEIVTGLAALVNLKSLIIQFPSSRSRPDRERRHLPPPIRTALPSLTYFEFEGDAEYLEGLVAQIDALLLDSVCITIFYGQITEFSQLGEFMRRTGRFQALNEAHVDFDPEGVLVTSLSLTQTVDEKSGFRILNEFSEPSGELSSMIPVLTSFLSSICIVEHLYIYGPDDLLPLWKDDVEGVQWPEIFLPFTVAKNLYLSKEIAQFIAPALRELVKESVRNVLPALENIFLEELEPSRPVQDAIGQFIAARQLLDHPVNVSQWNRTRETF